MTTGHVFIAVSMDGFIARKDGALDWLMKQKTEGEDHGYDDFMASVDGLVIGRGSFLKVLTFDEWPYEKPVVVMSASLGDNDIPAALRDRVRLSRLSPRALMAELGKEGWARAYVDGGKIIQSFLAEGLIADMVLTRIPILIGEGLPLFGPLENDIDLKHVSTRTFPSGLIGSTYQVSQQNE